MTSRDLKKGQRRRMFVVIPEERVYLVADPDVGIPEEISPPSSLKMEIVFNKIDLVLKKSMGKKDLSEFQSINLINQWLRIYPSF